MPSGSVVFVDTNVLLYALDPRDQGKQASAQAWLRRCWQDNSGRISTQVLHEMYASVRRAARNLSVEQARSAVRDYRAWGPWLVDEETVDIAWTLQDRFSLSYWDALMVAAAQQQGCRYMLSEDMQHEQRFDALTLLNPFLVGPEVLDKPLP
jgi:predicted nucleic acid-binding protein